MSPLPAILRKPLAESFRLEARARAALTSAPPQLAVVIACVLAVLLRAYIAHESIGSNDILTWQGFAASVSKNGLYRTYVLDTWFNHPPLMGLMAAALQDVAKATHQSFPFVFKLPMAIVSGLVMYFTQRAGKLGWLALALLLLNPLDILVCAYHGNTDVLCVAFCLAAALAGDRRRPALCGLALGAAMNVKLIPVVLIAPLFISMPGWRARLRFLLALGVGAVPFVPVLLNVFDAFVRNAIEYQSFRSPWGIGLFAFGTQDSLPRVSQFLWRMAQRSKRLILGGPAAYALVGLVGRDVSRVQLVAFSLSGFLVFAEGFGLQYLLYPMPFVILSRQRLGLLYAWVSGTFALLTYYWMWTHTFPPFSNFNRWLDLNSLVWGFVSWALLAYFWLRCGWQQLVALRERSLLAQRAASAS